MKRPHLARAQIVRLLQQCWLSLGVATLALAACHPPQARPPAMDAVEGRRAILLAIDSFNEQRALQTLDSRAIPAIAALFEEGACAASARPAFPSVTSPGLASLWTGAYGDVSGISANWQPALPRDEHTLLELVSGYLVTGLRAEPLWISAGAEGVRVTAHHVTQAPQPPQYRSISGRQRGAPGAAYDRAAGVLSLPHVSVVNGYNHRPIPDTLITEGAARPVPAVGWRKTASLTTALPLLEVAWKSGPDSLFALLLGGGSYTRMLIATSRDASGGVVVSAAPARPLSNAARMAEHFSEALELPRAGSPPVYVRFRLFRLGSDGRSFALFQPAIHVLDMNGPRTGKSSVRQSYESAVRGWVGNGAGLLYERGRFGPTLANGGDGTAESMYLETLENVTARYIEGSNWAWTVTRPRLFIDYFPLADEIDHRFFGYLDSGSPSYDARLAARINEVRQRAWMLVDHHLANLRRMVGNDPSAALFVSGDHGMRASWRVFSPNAALKDAGLLFLDDEGHIDLSRTRALSPNGYWVSVNGTGWKGGIVPPAEHKAAVDAAERALLAVRVPDGSPVVTRTWRTAEHDSLGLGGAVGGDLYYEVARGYRWTEAVNGPVTRDAALTAGHGFPSTSPDMHTVFCAAGASFARNRGPQARTIDVAPTVADWLGISPPRHARGRSVLGELKRGGGP